MWFHPLQCTRGGVYCGIPYIKMVLWNYVMAWMVSDIIFNTLMTNFQGGIMKDKSREDDSP